MPDPLMTDAWTLCIIGCEEEGVTLDQALIFAPPGTPMKKVVQLGGEAGIPHPYLRSAIVLGDDFDAADDCVDEMHPYVG